MLPGCLWVLPPEGGPDGWPWTALWPAPVDDRAAVIADADLTIAGTACFIAAMDWVLSRLQ